MSSCACFLSDGAELMGWLCDVPGGVGLWAEIRGGRQEERAQNSEAERRGVNTTVPEHLTSEKIRTKHVRSAENRLRQLGNAAAPAGSLTHQSGFRQLPHGLSYLLRPCGRKPIKLNF